MALKRATGDELHELFREVFVLHDALSKVMDDVHARAGMRTSQVRIGDVLERLGVATVPDVAAELGVSRQFVQTTCNELDAMGLIAFRDSPRHKRSKLVSLTDKGRRALGRAAGAEAAIIESALPDVDATKVTAATALLHAIAERIDSKRRK